MIAAGTMLSYWINFGLSFIETSVNWRFPIAFQIVFCIGLLAGVHFLPECTPSSLSSLLDVVADVVSV